MAVERTILDRITGKPKVAQPEIDIYDVPEPPKVDQNGYRTAEWTRWELLQAEGRLRRSNNGGTLPPTPAPDPVLVDLDDRIAATQARSRKIATEKAGIRARLNVARDDRNRRNLKEDLQKIEEEQLRVQNAESLLLTERTDTAGGRRRAIVQ